MGRQLVELGYRGMGDTIRREDFDSRKRMLLERTNQKTAAPKQLASLESDLTDYPFLQALATREELVRTGKLTTIVFIRDFNSKGQEISGYIDLAHACAPKILFLYSRGEKDYFQSPLTSATIIGRHNCRSQRQRRITK